jgi:hypothetical protein
MQVIERLADRTGYLGNSTKQSIIGGDLNLSQADWKGVVEGHSDTFINRLVWDNGYTQVVGKPTRGINNWMFILCDPKVHLCLAALYRKSVTIVGSY